MFIHFVIKGEEAVQDVFERLCKRDLLLRNNLNLNHKFPGINMSPIDLMRNHILEVICLFQTQFNKFNRFSF